MRHNRIKAFTLLELLVGMILSGIVLTATFTAYRIITRQYESYNGKSAAITEVSFLVSQLQADFENAATLIYNSENRISLQSESRVLEYRFREKYVLRNDLLRVDTFFVAVSGIETFMKSEKEESENSVIDELHIVMNLEGKKETKIYRKEINPKSEIEKLDSELK
ncbi:MAG: type II secretion system GspH family protein [Bacteroidota bacterium]|nr:type II secretion system GspH family protein [Bacteroidota bacterium]